MRASLALLNGQEPVHEETNRGSGQIVRKRQQADRMPVEVREVPEVASVGGSETTYHRCRAQYGGMKETTSSRSTSSRARTPG